MIAGTLTLCRIPIRRNKDSADDILVITNDAMSALSKLNHLKSLHLIGFGGRAGNDMHLIKLGEKKLFI